MSKKKHIFLIIFSLAAAFLGREIYKFSKMYETAWDAPAFQSMGPDDSPVTIIEFVDYNCPHCRASHPTIREALSLRPDIHFIARPIGPLSDESKDLVKLTLAAGKQGKFWELHHAFLSHRGVIGHSFLAKKAGELGIDLDRLYADAESEEVNAQFVANSNAASVLGVKYIPTFMINKTIYVPQNDDITVQDFLEVINNAS